MTKLQNGGQAHTYLPYERGIHVESLRVGSLFLDPLNPLDAPEDTRFEFLDNDFCSRPQADYEAAIKPYLRPEESDSHFSLHFERSKEASFELAVSAAHAESGVESDLSATLDGKAGRRWQLKRPQSFLTQKVLEQEGAREWIETQCGKRKNLLHNWGRAPTIWMVTGVQLVTGGEVHTGSTRGFNTGAGVEVDGSAIAALPPDVARAKADVNIDYSSGASAEYGHEDERVWAAQFMDILIDPKPHPDKEARKQGRLAVDVMSLKPPVDLRSRGMRRFRENNAPTNGHMNGPEATALLHLEDTDIDDALSDLAFDERPYHAAIGRIDWDKYALASQYENDLKTSSESEGSESDDEASITVS